MNNIAVSGTVLSTILFILVSALVLEVAVGQNNNNDDLDEAATMAATTTIGPSAEEGVTGTDVTTTTTPPTMLPTTMSPTALPTMPPTETITILNTIIPTQHVSTDFPTATVTTGTPTEESMPPTTSSMPTVAIPSFPPDKETPNIKLYNCSLDYQSHDEPTCNQYKDGMNSGHKDDECVCYYFCDQSGTGSGTGGYVQCLERGEAKEFGCSGNVPVISCLDKTKLEEEIAESAATPTIDSIKEALDSLYYTAAVALGAIICAF